MKTKLFILFAAIAFTFGTANVYAEGGDGAGATDSNEGTVTLNVHLYPIQTLVVKNHQTVTLEYKTKNDYANGVNSGVLAKHIEVYSTGGFQVKARANNANLVGEKGNTNVIDTKGITLTPANGENLLNVGKLNGVTLDGTTDVVIISSEAGGVDQTFDMTYAAAGSNTYINKYINSENPTKYTADITYTIVAQ